MAGVKREHDDQPLEGEGKRARDANQLLLADAASPSDALLTSRICFPFLNRGVCHYGANCKYRHISQDHPDAIADRMRTGRTPQRLVRAAIAPDRSRFPAVAPDVTHTASCTSLHA